MSTSETAPHITPVQVMFFDTDIGGVTHNTAYLRFIETGRTLFAVELGLDWKAMQEKSIFPVILRTEIDYHRPALVGDLLEVHSWLGKAAGVRFWCHFKIIRPSDNTHLVSCEQSLAFVKMPEGKPLRLPRGFPTPFFPETC